MVSIIVYKSQNSITGFDCSGHAGYAAYGEDVVCGSLSMLIINTINSIEKFTACKMKVRSDEEKGIIKVRFLKQPDDNALLLLEAMLLGIRTTKQQYGSKYVKLEYKEG